MQQWTAPSVFTNTAGTATFASDAGAGGVNLTVNDTAGSVLFTTTQHVAGLNISSGATAGITGGGTGHRSVMFTPILVVAGTLDLTANDLDVQNGGATALTSMTALIKQGFNKGSWTGTGITSSVAAGDSTHLTALGVILNTVNGNPLYTTFDGAAVAVNDVLLKYTYFGDANLDGKVDGSDYSQIDSGYLTHATGWFSGDFNYDGVINGSDYTLIDNAFNRQGTQLTAQIAGPTDQVATDVPEPTLLSLGIVAMSFLSRRRIRNRC